mgnify:CR=1 FL=1
MNADRLIQEYKKNGHPLGEVLRQEELNDLVAVLRLRLNATEKELDLAPYSLKRLEEKLRVYHQHLQDQGQQLTDDETVRFVREIAAYIGTVLMKHADATWRGGRSLWDTHVGVIGRVKLIDGSQKYYSSGGMWLGLGNQAASAWDATTQDRPTRMYSMYLSMRKKIAKQDLRQRR